MQAVQLTDWQRPAVVRQVPRPQPGPGDRLRAMLDMLRARWNEALAEGKVAAADRTRELQAQLAADTKRLPEFEVELLEAARERAPEAAREFERLSGRMKDEG